MDESSDLVNIEAVELQKISVAMKGLYSTWNEIGIDKDQKISRVQTAWSHIQSLVQDICEEEVGVCEDLKLRIKEYSDRISQLAELLCVKTPDLTGLCLIKREALLRQEHDSLTELKNNRCKELNDLRNLEKHYCLLLGMEEHKLSSVTEVPTLSDLNELKEYVRRLTEEHNKRYERYTKISRELSVILETTEVVPESSLEKHMCAGKEPLSLSDDTFRAIDGIMEKARKRKSELENEKQILMDKLLLLWERLNIDGETKMEFLTKHVDCKASTLNSIQNELLRCEEEKRKNMKAFIDSVRQELRALWDKCGVSELERQLFHLYGSEEVSEDILFAHEEEVEKWKAYYEEIKFILEKIEMRNRQWGCLIELENKANDPARFKNRGGNLLKEERQRNKLQKSLPSLEDDIFKRIEAYEKATGRKFLYLGEDYKSLIDKQREECFGHKENCKPEKYLQICTPVKRQQLATPKSAPCPRFKVYRPADKMMPKTARKPAKVIRKRDQDILKVIKHKEEAPPTDATTYNDFANELNRSVRRSFRSTIVTTKVGGTRTPTPVKKKKKFFNDGSNQNKEVVDLTSVRGKAGLPFLM